MEKIICQFNEYAIYEADNQCADAVAEFVLQENYKHHTGEYLDTNDGCETLHTNEIKYSNAKFYLARDKVGTLIGSIRIFHWNRRDLLPMERLFNINP